MRTLLPLAMVLVVTSIPGVLRAGDDLFTEIETGSVFAAPGGRPSPSAPPARAGARQPLISGLSLTDMFLAAGFDPKSGSDGVVAINLRREETNLTLRATLSPEERQLRLGVELTRIPAGQSVRSETLLDLLQANRDHRPAAFAYDPVERRLELHLVVSSDGLTTAKLHAQLDQLGRIALKTRDLWSAIGGSPRDTDGGDSASAAAHGDGASLVGQWIAARGVGNACALKLNADGTFRLAVVSGTQKSLSRGTYTQDGTKLTLAGDDGTRLAGTVQLRGDSFELESAENSGGAARLTFRRAR